MAYTYTTSPENAVPPNSLASPKTHTPGSRLQERGHRFYSPGIGRWTARDPISEPGAQVSIKLPSSRFFGRIGVDLYAFVENVPVGKYDGLGLESEPCCKCGPEVGDRLVESLFRAKRMFSELTAWGQFRACSLDRFYLQWDLNWNSFTTDDLKGCQTAGCKESVMVYGQCHWQWDVNYALFGVMCKLCGYSEETMLLMIEAYKLTHKPKELSAALLQWAYFGYSNFEPYVFGRDLGSRIPESPQRYKGCGTCGRGMTHPLQPLWP